MHAGKAVDVGPAKRSGTRLSRSPRVLKKLFTPYPFEKVRGKCTVQPSSLYTKVSVNRNGKFIFSKERKRWNYLWKACVLSWRFGFTCVVSVGLPCVPDREKKIYIY